MDEVMVVFRENILGWWVGWVCLVGMFGIFVASTNIGLPKMVVGDMVCRLDSGMPGFLVLGWSHFYTVGRRCYARDGDWMDLRRSFFLLRWCPLVVMWKRGGCWLLQGRHQFVANTFRWCHYWSCSKWLGYRGPGRRGHWNGNGLFLWVVRWCCNI